MRTIELCRQAYRDGHRRTLVALPTGAGKTEIFMHQAKTAISRGLKVLILVRRKSIVTQTAERIGSNVGVLMGRHMNGLDAGCVVASIDTIGRRFTKPGTKEFLDSFDLVIVDEAHDTTSNTYQKVLNHIVRLDTVAVLGYTATPYRIGKKGHGWWECCVKPVKAYELRDEGYLAPLTIYSPANMDIGSVGLSNGDFNNSELYTVVNQRKIYGKIVDTYEKLAKGQSAIVFCVNKEHSRRVCEAFKLRGFEAEHCDCGTDLSERERVLNYLKSTTTTKDKPFILCNVNIFSTGIDVPSVGVVIQARPTASKVLYIQQVGRALRTFNGKGKALLIDHGGNAMRFGSPYDDGLPELTDAKSFSKEQVVNKVLGHRCQACGFFASTPPDVCPGCGHRKAEDMIIPKESEEELALFRGETFKKLKKELYFIKEALYNKGKSADYAYYVLHNKHGDAVIEHLSELDCPDPIRRIITKKQRDLSRIKRRKETSYDIRERSKIYA